MYSFNDILNVSSEEVSLSLRSFPLLPATDFWLNPRRLRGSDFLMRWSQGVWSENRLIEAINKTNKYFAIPYGPSSTAPTNDVRAFELYFEKLTEAELGKIKRPDILIFKKSDKKTVNHFLKSIKGTQELPFLKENNLSPLLNKAILAIEAENSLWKSKKMPDYSTKLKPQRRLGGKPGLKKAAVLPTVIIKEEDREPLKKWQKRNKINIHIWHVFYDQAFGIALDTIEQLIADGLIDPTVQMFQAPGGATTKKIIYKIYYHYAYSLGSSVEEPALKSAYIEDKNGHVLPYVQFDGGQLKLHEEAINILDSL